MDPTNSKRRHICHQTSWLNYVCNSMNQARVLTVKGANIFTQYTTSKPNSHTPKHFMKVLDLPSWEISRSVAKAWLLTASGPTWKLQMDVVHQKDQDFQSLSKSTTKTTTTQSYMMRTMSRRPTPLAQWATDQALKTSPTSNLNHSQDHNLSQWPSTITTTIIITWDTRQTTCRTTTLSSKIISQTTNNTTNRLTITNIIIITHAGSKLTHHLLRVTTIVTRASMPSGLHERRYIKIYSDFLPHICFLKYKIIYV
jgi:hypothetical protein